MKRIMTEIEDKEIIFASEVREYGAGIVATYVPDSTGNHVYFMVRIPNSAFIFVNLTGQSLGDKLYNTVEDVIRAREEGSNSCCDGTKCYLFKDLKEVIKEFGK